MEIQFKLKVQLCKGTFGVATETLYLAGSSTDTLIRRLSSKRPSLEFVDG